MTFETAFVLLFSNFISDGPFVDMVSNIECARLCVNTVGCSSIFYNEDLMSCLVSLTRYRNTTGLTPHPGYDYYMVQTEFGMKCDSAADCTYQNSICYQGRCECEVGLSFLAHNMSCVAGCTEYGDDFHVYEYYGIYGYNTKTIITGKPESCKQACVEETSFDCFNVEYDFVSHECNLTNSTWSEIPQWHRETDATDWVLYYRHCAND